MFPLKSLNFAYQVQWIWQKEKSHILKPLSENILFLNLSVQMPMEKILIVLNGYEFV